MKYSDSVQIKGRSSRLINKRNNELAARFYFYNSIVGLQTDRCLKLLEEEFYISKATVYDNLLKVNHIVELLKVRQINVSQLQKWYPYLNWTARFSTQSPTFERWFSDQF